MVKDLFDTLQAVVEGFGVCHVSLSSVVCLGASKLTTRLCVKLLAISALLYKKSLLYATMGDCETNLYLVENFFAGTFF
jgi:hypothetical protein